MTQDINSIPTPTVAIPAAAETPAPAVAVPTAAETPAPAAAVPTAAETPTPAVVVPAVAETPAPAVAVPAVAETPAPAVAVPGILDNVNVTTSFKCSLELRNLLNRRAASTGTNISQLCVELIMKGLAAPEPGSIKVSDLAPVDLSTDTLEILRAEITKAIKAQAAQVVTESPKPEKVTVTVEKMPDNVIGFIASKEVKALVKRINEGRKAAGFAPLENSLCELLILSCVSLEDSHIMKKISGIGFSEFKKEFYPLLESERENNKGLSYLIPPSLGTIDSFKIKTAQK